MTALAQSILIALTFVLVACSSKPQAMAPHAGQDSTEARVEVETPEDQALQAIAATPTEFSLGFGEAQYAWERAEVFFNTHTDGAFIKMASGDGRLGLAPGSQDYASITNAPGGKVRAGSRDRFVYDVKRSGVRGGYRFSVSCIPATQSGDKNAAKRNALNLARFIKDGQLEAALLVR